MDSSAYGVLSFLEYIRQRILADGETNVINIVWNNIYCFWKLLSAVAVSMIPWEKATDGSALRGVHMDAIKNQSP